MSPGMPHTLWRIVGVGADHPLNGTTDEPFDPHSPYPGWKKDCWLGWGWGGVRLKIGPGPHTVGIFQFSIYGGRLGGGGYPQVTPGYPREAPRTINGPRAVTLAQDTQPSKDS